MSRLPETPAEQALRLATQRATMSAPASFNARVLRDQLAKGGWRQQEMGSELRSTILPDRARVTWWTRGPATVMLVEENLNEHGEAATGFLCLPLRSASHTARAIAPVTVTEGGLT